MLDEAILVAQKLHNLLEKVIDQSQENKFFNIDISIMLERYSWEIYRLSNELKEIEYYIRG